MRRKPLTVKVGKEKKKLSEMCACMYSFADVLNTKHSVKHIARNVCIKMSVKFLLRSLSGIEIFFFFFLICLTVLSGCEIS